MKNVSRPRLALPLAVLVAVVATIASSCSTFNGPAWQVGDVSMSVDQFYADYRASQDTGESESSSSSTTTTTAAARVPTADLAAFMTDQIQAQVIGQALAEKGITVTDEDRDNARNAIAQQAQQSGQAEAPTDLQVENQAGVVALGAALVTAEVEAGTLNIDDEVQQLWEENKDQIEPTPPQMCFHAIFVPAGDPTDPSGTAPTEEQKATALATAEQAVTRLATEDFEDVSADVSVLESQYEGGDLGCQESEGMPPALASLLEPLAPGALSAPTFLEGDNGYAILRLDSRTTEPTPAKFEDYEQRIQAFVIQEKAQQLVADRLGELFGQVSVTVDPRFGTWNEQTFVVDPPEGAATPTTPTTAGLSLDPSQLGGVAVDPSTSEPDGS